jgi:transposase InsO family protein
VKFAFILAEKAYPITALCNVLGVSRSGFHAWRKRPTALRIRSDAQLAAQVAAVHERSRKTYGSPRVHAELRAKGIRVGKKRIERLMRENGLEARRKRRFRKTTDSKHNQPIAPNVVARKFDVSAPNRVWATDVTAIWTLEGWLFLAVMLDLYSRRVVAWAASANNDTPLALDTLRAGLRSRRPKPGLVHHSDRGSPYASAEYRTALARHGLVASMSRKGDCWDNAVAESFFATLRAELVDHASYLTHDAAKLAIGEYIDGFYNIERRHSFLDYINPIEFELRSRATNGLKVAQITQHSRFDG